MKREILSYQFSIFGKYDKLYYNINEATTENKFSEFKKSLTTDILPDGRTFNCYIIANKDVRIAIHLNRIDFIFNQIGTNDVEKFKVYYSLFSNRIEFINRLAINFNFFFKDADDSLMHKISSLVKIFDKFGEASEFSYRTNQIFKKDDIIFNDVITIQNGGVQKNNSFEPIRALIFMCDINTAIGIRNIDLASNELIDCFNIMFKRLLDKIETANFIVEN